MTENGRYTIYPPRAERMAADLAQRTAFERPLSPSGHRALYPRLAALAPDAARRDQALRQLAPAAGRAPA
ncbi:MAG: hypothetical protein HYR50_06915 [Candidatus Rokubacteria bacterium]|nr:hypothetical protein [Candidatus Rokubacteria bacterium]